MSWPAVGERDYLFIRRIAVRDVPGRLAYRLADAVAESHAGAVSGFDARADQADAVYFATLADLLAALTLDLLAGRHRWYWHSWRFLFDASRDDAVIELWRQYLQQLPAIADHWSRTGVVLTLWPKLSQGVALTIARQLFPAVDTTDRASGPPANRVDWPASWLAPWQSVMLQHDVSPAARSLAALLIIKHRQTLCFMRSDVESVLPALMASLMGRSASVHADSDEAKNGDDRLDTAGIAASDDRIPDVRFTRRSEEEPALQWPAAQAIDRHESSDLTVILEGLPIIATPEKPTRDADRAVLESSFANQAQNLPGDIRKEVAAQTHYDPVHTIDDQTWRTATGGLFYLLNVLNLPGVQARLRADEKAMHYPSAWGWLYRMAAALNWVPDAAALTFLANECGLSNPERLDELPVFPALHDIVDIALLRYGDLVSSPSVVEVPARVTTDNVYLDLYFAMSSVRLDVRRVGLDIDPGWLVWLGRVVKFHFGDEGFQS